MYDLIIVGGGAAGLSAAVYAQRAMLKCAVAEKEFSTGGQIINTYEVDNYLGIPGINGYDLAVKFREHADKLGAEFLENEAVKIENRDGFKEITLDDGRVVKARAVIAACGARHRKLGVPGEEELSGFGVSYCATCDGAFFKGKTAAVVGGGDVAIEDAIFLARGCKKVYLIHRRDELRGSKILQAQLMRLDNVEIIWNTVVEKINGSDRVTSISIDTKGEKKEITLDGVFVAVGITPQSEAFKDILETDGDGYIIADETGKTSQEGIFAAGDVRTKALRQVITAAADGANCVYAVEKYLAEHK